MPPGDGNGVTTREADLIIKTIETLRADVCGQLTEMRKEQKCFVIKEDCQTDMAPLEGVKRKFYMILGGLVVLNILVPIALAFIIGKF